MDKFANGYRYRNYDQWDVLKNLPYNYEKYGLNNKILSHVIVNSKNKVLRIVLQFYEKSIIFLLKYVDILKNFKNPHWKNR